MLDENFTFRYDHICTFVLFFFLPHYLDNVSPYFVFRVISLSVICVTRDHTSKTGKE